MKPKWYERIGLTAVFSFVVFLTFLITTLIVAAGVHILTKSGLDARLRSYGLFVPALLLLCACTIVGTLVSFFVGKLPLRPFRRMIAAVNQLADGDFSVRLDMKGPPEIREFGDSFNRMAQELGGIEMLRTDFVNNFSHEFKTPIVSIKGFAELLRYADLSAEERTEYLDIMIRESSRLATLATNVLNLSKVENQEILSERERLNLGEQIRRCVLILQSKWEEKRLSMLVEVSDLFYEGNEELLSQVWLNLIDNAIKFTPEEGAVIISLFEHDDAAVFQIRDTGQGIAPGQMPHIFDKFYQADTSHAAAGNGLGLTLVRRIVKLHGGTVQCQSDPGEGTTFTVRLPI